MEGGKTGNLATPADGLCLNSDDSGRSSQSRRDASPAQGTLHNDNFEARPCWWRRAGRKIPDYGPITRLPQWQSE